MRIQNRPAERGRSIARDSAPRIARPGSSSRAGRAGRVAVGVPASTDGVVPAAGVVSDPADQIAAALFGKGQRVILGRLFSRPERRFYVRELARSADTTPSVIQRDLAALAGAGILERETEGRQVYYRAHPRCPIFEELKGIAVKTFGVADVLRAMLEPHRASVRLAFVYGSVASGAQTGASDVDLMIVGRIDTAAMARGLLEAERRLGRPVNPTVYGEAEFRKALAARQPFLDAVLSRPTLFVIGDRNELERFQRKSAKAR